MEEVNRAIVPISTFNSKFLPLSRIFPKAACPVSDKPIIHYLVKEIRDSEINEVVFVLDSSKNSLLQYFESPKDFEAVLKKNNREDVLMDLDELSKLTKGLKITTINQARPVSAAHAILLAGEKTSFAPAAILFADYLIDSEEPCISQLIKIFKTSQRPILGLNRIEKDRGYNTVDIEVIAKRVSKIKKIHLADSKHSSELGIIGRYIFNRELFDYLKQEKSHLKENLTIFNALDRMMTDGKSVYGYEFEGTMLECNNKLNWIKTNIYYSLKDSRHGSEIKSFIKKYI
ncbi:MAG: sugar phosphate nucleotidyltransferase [Candidatus Pacebacteria bacterium]|nr:sugar phosphate nucleotidyltransferase [Candidatus Paceibacterota bacterium]